MKKLLFIFKCLLILWIPIILIEETFLLKYLTETSSLILSFILSILCLIFYIFNYKKLNNINIYTYNISNTIILFITNLFLGILFLRFISLNIFHQCPYTGWECFLYGIEYPLIGFIYSCFSLLILIIWLFIRLFKYLKRKK